MTVPARPHFSTIVASDYMRTLTVQLEVMYGARKMLEVTESIPYTGIYQSLPEDDEAGQEKLQDLLAARDRSLPERSQRWTEQGKNMLAALRARLPQETRASDSSKHSPVIVTAV